MNDYEKKQLAITLNRALATGDHNTVQGVFDKKTPDKPVDPPEPMSVTVGPDDKYRPTPQWHVWNLMARDKNRSDVAKKLQCLADEVAELQKAIASGDTADTKDEFGDVVLSVYNLANALSLPIERCLNASLNKVIDRFNYFDQHGKYPHR